MTFKEFLLISTLVLYGNVHYTNAVPTLDIKWRRPVIQKNLTFSCRSDGAITQSVTFFTKSGLGSNLQGRCLASGTCGSIVPGYAVAQDRTARITTLFMTSFDMNRDDQTWICTDGSSSSLEYNELPTPVADVKCRPSQPGPIGKDDILTVTCETSCVYPEANYSVEVLSGGSGSVPSVTSSESCTGDNVTTKNVFEMRGDSSQVSCEVMFKVSIEHDSFIDFYPTYTLIKMIGPYYFPGLDCWPLLIVGIIFLVVGIIITVFFVLETLKFKQSDLSVDKLHKNTIIVQDLKDPKEVEASFESYLKKHYDDEVQKSGAKNGEKVWTIKGEASLSFNQRSGKCLNGTFEIKFKPGGPSIGNFRIEFEHTGLSIVQQEKNTIYVLNLTKPKEVEASFERYLKDNYSDVVKKSYTENGHKVWTIKGGEAHLSLKPPKGKVNVQHPKNTIYVLDLKDPKEVEASFEKYLKKHYDDVVKKSDTENGHKVWTIMGGEAHLSLNPPKGKVNVQHPKNTIFVPDLKDPKEVEASFESYLKKHYNDGVKKSDAENGDIVWTIKGAHLSLNSTKGKVNGTFEIKFKQSDLSIDQLPKNAIIVPDLTEGEEVEPSFEKYLEEHYADVGQMILVKALSSNIAESPDELAFRRGDVPTVTELDTGKDGLWLCSHRGRQGIAPGNRLKILSEEESISSSFENVSTTKSLDSSYVKKSDAENGHTLCNITGGEAHLSLNPPKGKVNGTFEIEFKQSDLSIGTFEIKFKQSDLSIVEHPKNTILVLDLKDPKEVEASCDSYIRKHYIVVKKSDAENGDIVWTIKGGEAHLSLNSTNGNINGTFEIEFERSGLSIVRHPKITMEPVLTDQKKVEVCFESYLKDHYAYVVKKKANQGDVVKNGHTVWTINGGEAHLSLNPPKGKVNGKHGIMFQQGDPSIGTLEIMFKQGDPSIADKLRLVNFIYSIIHSAAGFIMMIITAVLACKPLEGVCIGALIFSLLNLLYGIGNIIVTLKWKHKSYVWLRRDF